MLLLILDVAQKDANIRTAHMNGSRANPNAPKDAWQDFDIIYGVTNLEPFRQDSEWLDAFGPRIMLQEPARMDALRGGPPPQEDCVTFLMLLADGNRIDLTVETTACTQRTYGEDTLTVPLLDKDGILPPIGRSSDQGYWIARPTEGAFIACANNFWWCLQNVAKGIMRRELPYARSMFEQVVRPELDQMVSWWIGHQHAYAVNVGKFGKWMERYMPADLWALYTGTMAGPAYADQWAAIDAACTLFGQMGMELGRALTLPYPAEDDARMRSYLHALRAAWAKHDDG